MKESVRRTLLGCKVVDIEVRPSGLMFYLKNEHGACYSVGVQGQVGNVLFLDGIEKKVAALEGPVQKQPKININKLRIKNGLKPILNGDIDLIPIKQSDNENRD